MLDVATNCVSVHGTYIALEPSLDGTEPTAFKAVVLSEHPRVFRIQRIRFGIGRRHFSRKALLVSEITPLWDPGKLGAYSTQRIGGVK